jgi:tetratricopeptide (TPR) repeat protein
MAAGTIRPSQELSRAIEMQHAALIIGGLLLVCLTFYVGKKFEYWRYLYETRLQTKLPGSVPSKFSDVSSEDLVEQALTDERSGKWGEAAERLIAAKHKNLAYRDIFFHVGKIAYDHKDYDTADKLFERAIAFRENVEGANYFRGLIATSRHDLNAAERFFEAAANEAPLAANHYYYWGEALRLNFHPQEAIRRFEQAGRRAGNDQDETLCRFKIRMARLEAAQSPEINAEIEKQRSAGPMSVDWLMTAAALKIREGHIDEARQLMAQAHAANQPGLFASCLNDAVFQDACQKHNELAEVCRMDPGIQARFP